MKITLVPQRRNTMLHLSKSGDVLDLNGQVFDFSNIPDGATLPLTAINCDWFVDDVVRTNGVLHLSLILPHGAGAPHETLYPQPITVLADGQIELPVYSITEVAV